MPEKGNPHVRLAKKRRTNETASTKDGCDSSFVSPSNELQEKQMHEHHSFTDKVVQEIKLPEFISGPLQHWDERFDLKYLTDKPLKEHMYSILSEVKEAREKLFQWWRQEIQIIVATTAGQRRVCDMDAGRKQEQVDHEVSGDHARAQAFPNEGPIHQKNSQGFFKCEPTKPQIYEEAPRGNADDITDVEKRRSELISPDPKLTVVDVVNEVASTATRKTSKEMHQSLSGSTGDDARLKVVVATMDKLPGDSRNVLFDTCFGAELGDDVKDEEGLDGTLDSGVTMREGFEFSKASNDIQKGLDHLDRLRETKSAFLDMGFDEDESNDGNGVGCSLESGASSRVNSCLSKTSMSIQSNFKKGSNAGFGAACGEKGKDRFDFNCGPDGGAKTADIYLSAKVKKEGCWEEEKQAVVKEVLAHGAKRSRLDDGGKRIECIMGAQSGQASINESYIVDGSAAMVSQPIDCQQQVGMGTTSAIGIKRAFAAAMTFKGSALDCRNDVFPHGNSYADVFNSANASILVESPAPDKGNEESLALPNASNTLGLPGAMVSPRWNMFSAPKSGLDQALHDSKIASLEYASRSKFGDAILSSGRTVEYPGIDPVPAGYMSHFKVGMDLMNSYQPERAHTSSMYFSPPCMNNSVYLPTTNRLISMQHSPPSSSPSSCSGLWPRLVSVPSHVGGRHDSSNMHTFLGLGMNGVPAVANGMHGFPGSYVQSNQQHNQAPFRNAPQSSMPTVSHQESSAAQEKAVLELNF